MQRYFRNYLKICFCLFSFTEHCRNIQDQISHLQHIIQLLPLINRDTLYVLLQFLGLVAENAEDKIDESGEKGMIAAGSQFI